jgi:hypothetical protein
MTTKGILNYDMMNIYKFICLLSKKKYYYLEAPSFIGIYFVICYHKFMFNN